MALDRATVCWKKQCEFFCKVKYEFSVKLQLTYDNVRFPLMDFRSLGTLTVVHLHYVFV